MHANASLDEMVAWLDAELEAARFREHEPDANGLVAASGEPGVTKFAVAVNASLTAIVGAARTGAQLLVTHHASWPAIDLHLREEKLEALKMAGVSHYAAHASLDCAPRVGNGWVLAAQLGISVEDAFGEYHGGQPGVIGRCDGSFAQFVQHASRALRVQVEAHEHAKAFGRVAIVTGGGGETALLDEARRLGADTYVTGEGSMYTRMFAKECGINLVFGSHYATEAPGIRALGERLSLHAGIPFEFIDESSDVF